jgi:outer membrane protein assembly factor BamB
MPIAVVFGANFLRNIRMTNCGFPNRFKFLTSLLCAVIAGPLMSAGQTGGQWPNWRGPNSSGSVEAGNFPVKWDLANVAWKVALPGKGSSTPIVLNDRIYVSAPDAGEDAVLAYDMSGRLLWQRKLGAESPPKHRTLASSCNASPVTDGQSIFVYFRSGNLAALDLEGQVRWQINLVERFGRDQLFWDQGTSPVVTDKHLVMARMHGGESWLAGFDKTTGELRWQQPRNYKVPTENDNGYTTPVIFEQSGKKALLIWGADHLTAHQAEDGKLIWACGKFNPDATGYWPAIATPAVVGDIAVVPVGRDDRPGQSRVHGIKLGGSGDVSDTHRAWKRDDLGVFVCSPAEYKNRVYLLRHRGEVVCLDPTTGKTLWEGAFPKSKSSYYSSPIIGNGLLYAAREDGVVFVARVAEKFEFLSENAMEERIIASPVLVGNRLLLRGDKHLFCVSE